MRIAIISDVHGNFAALDAVNADLARHDPDLVIHLSDVVVLGPRLGMVGPRAGCQVIDRRGAQITAPRILDRHPQAEGMAPAIRVLAQGLGLSLPEQPFIAAHTDTLL